MKPNIICSLLIIFSHLCLPSTCVAWFNSWPELATPVGVQTQWIAKDIQHNGIDMQILQLEGPVPADKTLFFYQNLWESSKAKYKIFGAGDQIVVSTIVHQFNGDYQLTLELKAHKTHTQGILSSMRLNHIQAHQAAALNPHLPQGSKILSNTLALDLNSLNRVVVATNTQSLGQALFHFRNILREQGWQEEEIKKQNNKNFRREVLLRFFKEQDELIISLFAEQDTKIVATYIRRK